MMNRRPLHFLIKSASSLCNMRCHYCFYADVSDHRDVKSFGMMSLETVEALAAKAFAANPLEVAFAFQGGEPSLRGLEFYQDFVEIIAKHNAEQVPVHYSMQTNAYVIDDAWIAFFKAHQFLLGISLDGTVKTHNKNRVDSSHEGTFRKVWNVILKLQEAQVEFNILTVVNRDVAENIEKIYPFYMQKGLFYQQYIPCLDPLEEERGQHPYSLTPELYGEFLVKLFDMWYQDVKRGQFIYIRFFENLVGMLLGHPPEACGMVGICQPQLVLEADGGVYPCDFYVLDHLRLGNINDDSLAKIEQARLETGFIDQSRPRADACEVCEYLPLCRGGCRRDREPQIGDEMSLNYFCPSYKRFYAHALPKLQEIALRVSQR